MTWLKRQRKRRYQCHTVPHSARYTQRQELIRGWQQGRLEKARIMMIGNGSLGGGIAFGLVRKGVGELHCVDPDYVEPSNLTRQFFTIRDVGKYKSIALCRELQRWGHLGTTLVAEPSRFQDQDLHGPIADIIVCAVDNQFKGTRLDVARYGHSEHIPFVMLGLTEDADAGYCFVQEPGKACWACVFGADEETQSPATCPVVAASVDIATVLTGWALYAVDTILMERKRDWNYVYASLSQSRRHVMQWVDPDPHCPVCGDGKSTTEEATA